MTSIIERRPVEHVQNAPVCDSMLLVDMLVQSGSLQSVASAARVHLYAPPAANVYSAVPAGAMGARPVYAATGGQLTSVRQLQLQQPQSSASAALPSFLVDPHTHAAARAPPPLASANTESPTTGPPLPARQPPVAPAHLMQLAAGASQPPLISSAGLFSTTPIQQLPQT